MKELADDLPNDATWEDVMHRVYVREAIEAGRKDAAADRLTAKRRRVACVKQAGSPGDAVMYSIEDVGNICFICLLMFAAFSLIGLKGAGPMIAALAVVVVTAAILRK